MSTTTRPTTGLHAEAVRAFRMADRVSFHHTCGSSEIRLYTGRSYDAETTTVVVTKARLTDYSTDTIADRLTVDRATCFASLGHCHHQENWCAFLAALKTGDTLLLDWTRDALKSQALDAVGIHGDTVDLVILRPAAKQDRARRLGYRLDEWIGPDNSARMIRPH